MKKLTIGVSSFIAGAVLMTSISSYAAPVLQKITANINNTITLKLNGNKVKTEQPILTYNGRTYVYLKEVGNLVGASVEWNNTDKSIAITTNNQKETNNDETAEMKETSYEGFSAIQIKDTVFVNIIEFELKYANQIPYVYDNSKKILTIKSTNEQFDLNLPENKINYKGAIYLNSIIIQKLLLEVDQSYSH